MNHLVAKIGEKIVSNPFLVPKAKIIDLCFDDDGLVMKIENLTNEDIENIHIVCSSSTEILDVINLEASDQLETKIKIFYGEVHFYLEKDGMIICNAYEASLPKREENDERGNSFEDDIRGMTENQKNIARYLKNYYPQFAETKVVSAINLLNTEIYQEVYDYLVSTNDLPYIPH